jgi:hypothetical protein
MWVLVVMLLLLLLLLQGSCSVCVSTRAYSLCVLHFGRRLRLHWMRCDAAQQQYVRWATVRVSRL